MTRIVTEATRAKLPLPKVRRSLTTVAAETGRVAMYLYLPEPPSANRYWRNWRGRMVVSAEARAYKARVWAEAVRCKHRPMSGPVRVTLFWRRKAKRGDLDNRIKVVLDAIKGTLYDDDKQVVEIHARRMDLPENPGLTVTVEVAP